MYEDGIWITISGALVSIKAMSDSHIKNTIKMLERKCSENSIFNILRQSKIKEFKAELYRRHTLEFHTVLEDLIK